ncbi:transcriptional initiation protein Tat [Paraburkholderia silviterrae]|uniref:Transcriptional initiation protein Tat n=1 Tax=Paraburkholderia silviterrae TaxID=2528715 RepID=A0A4R5M444_9BURK|nr:transcriptional initiation protein Tat [Paraburkholderia silviterrae]TDG20455.1 transcriptional initiation protein Tat [Paraburkholderia silviterrae]
MNGLYKRRGALKTIGIAAGTVFLNAAGQSRAIAAETASLLPQGATRLAELTRRLAAAPRRRDFKSVPMILDDREQWDYEALAEVFGYQGQPRQVWVNTDLAGQWPDAMRNALNTEIWSFRHPDTLLVAATHGSAHLALLDQAAWNKYALGQLPGNKLTSNTQLRKLPAQSIGVGDHRNVAGAYSTQDNSIPALLARGVVFMTCHNAIWELAETLHAAGSNPDKLAVDALAADLTNHVIPQAIVTPGIVATVLELQQAGFHYAH